MARLEHEIFGILATGVALVVVIAVVVPGPTGCGSTRRVDVPWASTATVIESTERDLVIAVAADRRLLIGPTLVPHDLLADELRRLIAMAPDRTVTLEADRAVPYGDIGDVIAALRDAGVRSVTLVTFRGTPLDADQRRAGLFGRPGGRTFRSAVTP